MVTVHTVLLVFLMMLTGNENIDKLSLVASTPADLPLRKTLNIDPALAVDFIRWRLELKNNQFELSLNYGESQPNTMGFKSGDISSTYRGRYTVAFSPEYNTDIYTLKSDQLGNELALLKINNNIYQILETSSSLMNGNGGWSYTLNNTNPETKPYPSALTFHTTKHPARRIIYDGRTPCEEFSSEYKLAVTPGCFKLKWRLILEFDSITQKPGSYSLRHYEGSGKWTIVTGSTKFPNAEIYQLNPGDPEHSISFLKGDNNVLYFLDKDFNLLVGNKDFSYTLNQVKQ